MSQQPSYKSRVRAKPVEVLKPTPPSAEKRLETPRVAMISMWMNDASRRLNDRADMILNKSYSNLHWIWLVGDSTDGTAQLLQQRVAERWADRADRVKLLQFETGLTVSNGEERLKRISATMNVGFDCITREDDYVIVHESDLESPTDLVERMLATGKCPLAGWVTLQVNPVENVFYDTWAFRCNGKLFSDKPPYCDNYKPDEPFTVDSIGSVWLIHAQDVLDGVRMDARACYEYTTKLRTRGRTLWVDPTLRIVQPADLWVPTILSP